MSSFPSGVSQVRLVADGGYPNAEVSVLNANYEIVARAVGRIDVTLLCGFYKVRYRAGSAFEERFVELSPSDTVVTLDPPKWSLNTAIPISNSNRSTPDLQQAAVSLSKRSDVTSGATGSRIFVFLSSAQNEAKEEGQFPAGLKLRSLSGTLLVDISAKALETKSSGCNIEVAPGSYLLQLERHDDDTLEQTVVACAGWQTQVFLSLSSLSLSEPTRLPDFSNSAIMIADPDRGFDPFAQEYGWAEAARQELALGRRPVIPEQEIREALRLAKEAHASAADPSLIHSMLRAKFISPILGIYAAHLMMMAPGKDLSLIDEVAGNLKSLLGPHPDVVAIDLWLNENAEAPPLVVPPMLRSSWAIFVNRSRKREDLIPSGSYALGISDRLWGTGAWLVWRKPDFAAVEEPQEVPPENIFSRFTPSFLERKPTDVAGILQWSRQRIQSAPPTDVVREASETMRLSGLERNVFAYVVELADQQNFMNQVSERIARTGTFGAVSGLYRKFVPSTLSKNTEAKLVEYLSVDNVVQNLGVPQAAAHDALTGLTKKFNAKIRRVLSRSSKSSSQKRFLNH